MADELTVDTVREFIALNDGKVKNTVLVAHFKKILNNPNSKAEARQKFKNCVNEVAVVKTENGEKYVQLKKKFRTAMPVSSSSSLSYVIPESHSTQASPSHISSFDNPLVAEPENPILYADHPEGFGVYTEERKHSNASRNERSTEPDTDDNIFKPLSDKPPDNIGVSITEIKHKPIHESSKKTSTRNHEGHEIPEQSDDKRVEQNENIPPSNNIVPIGAVERARLNLQNKGGDSDDTSSIAHSEHQSESIKDGEQEFYDKGVGQFTDPLEKQWVLACARGNMFELRKLLNQDPNLAEKKDFILTALHWAAKKGNVDLVKMFGDAGVEINTKSKGGYTPVHLAAMNGHKKALKVLVDEYDADTTIRDHSGKLAQYYLEAQSFSLPLQKLLLGNDGHSSVKDFTLGLRPRLDSVRKSKRLGDAISGGVGVLGALVKGRATSSEDLSNPGSGSPAIGRKGSLKGKSKKKSRKWGSREEKSNLVRNDDTDSGFSGGVSGTSSMSSAQDLRYSHLSHGDMSSLRSRGGSTNSRYQDYNESE